jgi:hypothetical protein
MNRSTKIIAALVAAPLTLLIAGTATAADDIPRPSYKFVEVDYVYGTADVKSDQLSSQANKDTWNFSEGIALKASYVFVEQLLVRGSYYAGSGEWKKTADVDASSGLIGISWLAPTTDATGIDVGLDYRADNIQFKNSNKNFDEDIEGVGFSFGVRAAPSKNTEFGARVGWYEGDYEGAIGFNINAAWNINESWGITAYWDNIDADVNKDTLTSYELNQFGIGGRFYF